MDVATMRQLLLLSSFWLSMASAQSVVTQTVVLIQTTSGFATLTGTAASQVLATTTRSGPLASDPAPDGLGVPVGGVGAINVTDTGDEGVESGSWSISTGAIIGICVGVALLCIAIFTVWLLWFLTKKRGWDVRKSISRASRRLTGRFTENRSRRTSTKNAARMDSPQSRTRDRDIEKARGTEKVKAVAVENSPSTKRDRRTAMILPTSTTKQASATARSTTTVTAGQRSGFDAETPVTKSFKEKYLRRQ